MTSNLQTKKILDANFTIIKIIQKREKKFFQWRKIYILQNYYTKLFYLKSSISIFCQYFHYSIKKILKKKLFQKKGKITKLY